MQKNMDLSWLGPGVPPCYVNPLWLSQAWMEYANQSAPPMKAKKSFLIDSILSTDGNDKRTGNEEVLRMASHPYYPAVLPAPTTNAYSNSIGKSQKLHTPNLRQNATECTWSK